MLIWVNWCHQQAGNDGRRPSGNVFKRGKWHLVEHRWRSDVSDDMVARTACRRETNLWPKYRAIDGVPDGACQRCAKLATLLPPTP